MPRRLLDLVRLWAPGFGEVNDAMGLMAVTIVFACTGVLALLIYLLLLRNPEEIGEKAPWAGRKLRRWPRQRASPLVPSTELVSAGR